MGSNEQINGRIKIPDQVENGVLSVFFWSIFVVLLLQFFTRFVLNSPFGWTEEIARILLICLCFSGGVVNTRRSSEISLEFTRTRLPPHMAKFVDVYLVKTFSVIVYFWLAWIAAQYAMRTRQSLSSILFPKKYIIFFVCICLIMMGLRSIQSIIKAHKHPSVKKESQK